MHAAQTFLPVGMRPSIQQPHEPPLPAVTSPLSTPWHFQDTVKNVTCPVCFYSSSNLLVTAKQNKLKHNFQHQNSAAQGHNTTNISGNTKFPSQKKPAYSEHRQNSRQAWGSAKQSSTFLAWLDNRLLGSPECQSSSQNPDAKGVGGGLKQNVTTKDIANNYGSSIS